MIARILIISTLAAATAASAARPVSVTRFSESRDIARAPAMPAAPAPSLEQKTYEDAVGRELARTGFGGEGDARYTYIVEVTHTTRSAPVRRSPVTIGIGGGTGGYGGGFGLGASFGLGSSRASATSATQVFVQLRDRVSGKTVWEGRAQAEGTRPADTSVERLAAALFRDFPGESGRTISVR